MNKSIIYQVGKHETVTAQVGNVTQQQFKFTVNEKLRDKPIQGLTFHPSQYLTKDQLGNPLVPASLSLANCFLTLKTKLGIEEFNAVPLYLLAAGVSTGGTYEKMMAIDNKIIDWENSYISCGTSSIFTTGQVFLISVFYSDSAVGCSTK